MEMTTEKKHRNGGGRKWKMVVRLIVIGVAVLTMCGAGMAIQARTLVSGWWPATAALTVAAGTLPAFAPKWRRMVGTDSRVAGSLCHLCFVGAAAYLLLLGGNSLPGSGPVRPIVVTVQDKYVSQHTKYRRVGRGRMQPYGTYDTRHVVLAFPDGVTKKVTVGLSEYNRTRRGERQSVGLRTGWLGFRIMEWRIGERRKLAAIRPRNVGRNVRRGHPAGG